MQESQRPTLGLDREIDPVKAFVNELQTAIDAGDASHFNRHFAQDVLWGSPFGAVAVGYDQIHAIHSQMFASVVPVKGAAHYEVEHARILSEDVAIAYVRRLSKHTPELPAMGRPGAFDELALLVLVRRDGHWWLAAAQHVPDRRDVYAKPNNS
ncbi:MAG: SgcJ/EcaC family oxidoreductase [Aureliella sp.]